MAVISVMSAKGAPGATTVSLLLATLWPAPSLVLDADPLGGDLALRLPRADGHAMDPERGLLSLLPAARRGLIPESVADHAQEAMGGQPVLAGLPGPEQALAAAPLWPTLADVFTRVPAADVFVDAGQVQSRSEHLPLVQRSDVLLCVHRPTAWSALHTRRRLEAMSDVLRDQGVRVGLVGVASASQEQDRLSAVAAITTGLDRVVDYGPVAWDPKSVVMFEGVVVYRPERTLLARSGRTVAQQLHADLAAAGVLAEQRAGAAPVPGADAVLPGQEAEETRRRGRRRAGRRTRDAREAT